MIYASKYILHRLRYVALSRIALTSMLVSVGGRSSFSNNGKLHESIVLVDELQKINMKAVFRCFEDSSKLDAFICSYIEEEIRYVL